MPVRINILERKPVGTDAEADRLTEAEQEEWVKRMQATLATAADDHIQADYDTPSGNLHMQCHRFRSANAAIWSGGRGADVPFAFSVFLCGRDGKDDGEALAAFRAIPSLAEFPAAEFVKLQAATRPCIGLWNYNATWYQSGHVHLASLALSVATMAKPGDTPKLEDPDRKLTPEEEARQNREFADIGAVFRIIQNDWVTRKTLRYTVKPSERVSGRPVSEIMHVTFWTGVQGQGRHLSINGLVALFVWLGDYIQKVPNLHHMKNPTTQHEISLRHEPRFIEAVLKQIKMTEPA
jgi:hypothetical protein